MPHYTSRDWLRHKACHEKYGGLVAILICGIAHRPGSDGNLAFAIPEYE
jgi:hypothetical protein